MSIKASNWAWLQILEPTPKLILMALADIADDDGHCWPKLQTLAEKCCVSTRTIQRWLKVFKSSGLLTIRERHDGRRQTSNMYTLHMDQKSNVLIATRKNPEEVNRENPSIEACLNPSLHEKSLPYEKISPEQETKRTLKTRDSHLRFPTELSSHEKKLIEQLVATVPNSQQQQLLDELRGALAAQIIHTSIFSWFRTLTKRAQEGAFLPNYTFSSIDEEHSVPTPHPPLPCTRELRLQKIQEIKRLIPALNRRYKPPTHVRKFDNRSSERRKQEVIE